MLCNIRCGRTYSATHYQYPRPLAGFTGPLCGMKGIRLSSEHGKGRDEKRGRRMKRELKGEGKRLACWGMEYGLLYSQHNQADMTGGHIYPGNTSSVTAKNFICMVAVYYYTWRFYSITITVQTVNTQHVVTYLLI